MRRDGVAEDELVVYMKGCGPDSAFLVEAAGSHSAAVTSSLSS